MIGLQVTMILTLVGLSAGVLGDIAQRSRGTGADIVIIPGGGSMLAFSGSMSEGLVGAVRKVPHVALATGVFHQGVGNFEAIDGINLQEFNQMSGGFQYDAGGPFTKGGELIVDRFYAEQKHLKVGDTVKTGLDWTVVGIVEPGKLSRMFADLRYMQDRYSGEGKVTTIYVKADNPAHTDDLKDALEKLLPDKSVHSMEELTSIITVDSIPILKTFTNVVIWLGVLVGFLAVFLSMYTAVLERTREIGILKALGASPGYILGMLMRETTLLAIVGAIAGIAMSYGSQWLMRVFVPTMPVEIVQAWWPRAAGLALIASLIGAIYPGLKAARQDAIEALSYD